MEPTELRRVFAANVKKRAKRKKVSLNTLAELAGIARSPFYRALSGKSAVTLDRLCKIANALDCEPEDLLRRPRP